MCVCVCVCVCIMTDCALRTTAVSFAPVISGIYLLYHFFFEHLVHLAVLRTEGLEVEYQSVKKISIEHSSYYYGAKIQLRPWHFGPKVGKFDFLKGQQ